MSRLSRRLIGSVALAVIASLPVWVIRSNAGKESSEEEKEAPIRRAARVTRTKEGDPLIELDKDTQARIGLATAQLSAASLQRQVVAYGRLQEDPSRTYELRAPAAGILRAAANRAWPNIGDVLAGGSVVGLLEPRYTSLDRLNLTDRLLAAQAEAEAAGASLEAARAAWERVRTLNAENKNVSDRALQEAEARLKSEEAKQKGAVATVKLIEASIQPPQNSVPRNPLTVEQGGEVTTILVQPGEAIESGQPILRLMRFDSLIARANIPAGQSVPPSSRTARIIPLGHESESLRGERIAAGASIDPETQGQSLLFRVAVPRGDLRPGLAVTAYVTLHGPSLSGVVIPESAVVRTAGKAWVYIKSGENQFLRKEVILDNPVEKGWFTARGFAAGEHVVVAGGQILLSEELKFQIQVGEENPA